MINATQLTKLTRESKEEVVKTAQEVIHRHHDNIENTLLKANRNCANSAVYTFSKTRDLEPIGIKTWEQKTIFLHEVHKYFESLGFQVSNWVTGFDGLAFEIKWPE